MVAWSPFSLPPRNSLHLLRELSVGFWFLFFFYPLFISSNPLHIPGFSQVVHRLSTWHFNWMKCPSSWNTLTAARSYWQQDLTWKLFKKKTLPRYVKKRLLCIWAVRKRERAKLSVNSRKPAAKARQVALLFSWGFALKYTSIVSSMLSF